MTIPRFSDIRDAQKRISKWAHYTPVLQSTLINTHCGCHLYFKCENFQKTGAFKYRGASNAVLKMSREKLKHGLCTHSSGNHAQALSMAAKAAGVKAHIVMPETAADNKVAAVKAYGADIYFCDATLVAREEKLSEIQESTGAFFIHPYDNSDIIAGQGTAVMELLDSIPETEIIIAPVGGGGLMSGTSIAARHIKPNIDIIGAEPEGADDAKQSFYAGRLIPSINPKTIADGLLTSLSERTFSILSNNTDDIITCSDANIIKAMRLIFERMKIVVEPSAAVPLAVILESPDQFRNKKIGLIVSGGNANWASHYIQ